MRDFRRVLAIVVCCLWKLCIGDIAATIDNWDLLPTDAVILKINKSEFTKSDFERQAEFWMVLGANRHGGVVNDNVKMMIQKNKAQLIDSFIFNKMVELDEKLVNFDVADENIRLKLEAKYSRSFGASQQGFSNLVSFVESEGYGDEFKSRFNGEMKFAMYFAANYSNEVTVTDKDIDLQYRRIKNYNANAELTNQVIVATVTNVLKQIAAGANFAELAKKYSYTDDKDTGGDMGDCWAEAFADEGEEYWSTVSVLKPGEVSGLLKTSEGYEVVKNIGDSEYTEADGIHLARITFRCPLKLPMLPRDELKAGMESNRQEKAMKKAQIAVRKRNSLKFPYGKQILKTWKINKE